MSLAMMYMGRLGPRGTPTAPVTPFFEDDFSSGDLSKTQNGFTWEDAAWSTVSTENPRTGAYSLRLRYGASTEPYDDTIAEQRFQMGRFLPHVWVEYYVWIPSNFSHRYNANHNNNKFFTLWRDELEYSDFYGGTQQLLFEFWRKSDNDTNGLRTVIRMYRQDGSEGTAYASDYPYDYVHQGELYPKPVFMSDDGPMYKGQWNKVRVEVLGSSAKGVSDGIIRFWANDTLLRDFTDVPMWNSFNTPTDVLFKWGYIMGSANSGYDEQTIFYIADIKFYDTDPGWL